MDALKAKLAGIQGITESSRGTLIVTAIRSILTFGLEARGVSPKDLRTLEVVDNRISRLVSHMPLWRMDELRINQHDIRYRLNIPPLTTAIHYKKATYLGHTMRRDDDWLPKIALTGRFFPSLLTPD